MPQPTRMKLKVLLPFGVFAEQAGVSRIVAETREGSFGLLPHRLDCVAALAPGILIYETEAEGEVFVAVDEGRAGQDRAGGARVGAPRAGRHGPRPACATRWSGSS